MSAVTKRELELALKVAHLERTILAIKQDAEHGIAMSINDDYGHGMTRQAEDTLATIRKARA